MAPLLLALDQGTTNTKALLVDRQGEVVFRMHVPILLKTLEGGFVEQDATELWASVRDVVARAVTAARELRGEIAGVAISNQRETAVAWNRETGEPLAPAISWQCRRSQDVCARVAAHGDAIRRVTGLPLDPVLSATKWTWMLEHVSAVGDAAAREMLCLGTVDSWLLYKLSGGAAHATDTTNASRTGLMDLEAVRWSEPMLEIFGLPARAMPELRASSGGFATCAGGDGLEGVPVVAIAGDSHAALAGHGAFSPGMIKATYGTGSSLMTLTPRLAEDIPSLSRTIAWTIGSETQYALEGNIFMSGAAVQWVGQFLGMKNPAVEAAALAESVEDTAKLFFVPAMVGLGAPYWDASARGLLWGLDHCHTAAHMARAAVEAIAYQVADVFVAMEGVVGAPLAALCADGGATRNRSLMQFQADVLGVPVLRSKQEELSAIGVAYLGGLTLGWWTSFEAIAALPRFVECIDPGMGKDEREERYALWQSAVRRARSQVGTA